MRLTLDNLDGRGPVDYSSALESSEPLTIERTLNAPSTLKGLLCLAGSSLPIPVRRARVVASSDANSAILFTGYLTVEPVAVYAGAASSGPIFRYALSAISDEWLLDKQAAGAPTTAGLGGTSAALLSTLAQRLDGNALASTGLLAGRPLGVLEPPPGATWSAQAGALANAAYSSYRALNGSLSLNLASSVQHSFSDGDGSFSLAALHTASVRELANDVTVTGAEEPSAFITELFVGDGTTFLFNLLGEPAAPSSGHAVIVADPFNQPALDTEIWQVADPGSNLALSGAGLSFTGGTGFDGQTTLTAWNPLELGGTVVLELGSVSLAAGSAGMLGGLYTGAPVLANCFAGFRIRAASGQVIAVPVVQGVETGTPLTLVAGHRYTLRLHLHAPELLRVKQTFYALVDPGSGPSVDSFGGGTLPSSVALVFEARDLGASSNTPVTVLYDGTVASSPSQSSVVAVNSLNLTGSLGSFSVTRTGSCWITSAPTSGTPFTRLAGTLAEGVDFMVTPGSQGKITFFPGRVPVPGESIFVHYRGRRRAVARVADPVSLAAEAAGAAPGTCRWIGHITHPPARSTEDCEAAATAILAFSTNRAAAVFRQLPLHQPRSRRHLARRHPQLYRGRPKHQLHRPPHLPFHAGRKPRIPHLSHRLRQRLGRRPRPQALRVHRRRRPAPRLRPQPPPRLTARARPPRPRLVSRSSPSPSPRRPCSQSTPGWTLHPAEASKSAAATEASVSEPAAYRAPTSSSAAPSAASQSQSPASRKSSSSACTTRPPRPSSRVTPPLSTPISPPARPCELSS